MEKLAAILTIKDAPLLTPTGKKDVASWLRRQARDLIKHGDDYGSVCRARYVFSVTDEGE